ncbi:MarC family protein [Synechococcus sp. RSCCF101]|uniref:MarC family protein n=1 Tax=Synechococcus sp. RSCCF101 TaxID=2511069 RepID=UPI001247B174|nr:MarC family protein [Synechococcus sp. RSCCF101]QEY31217.1 MarC family protein [Synechococcus sp. RSCCF101]
MSLPGDPTWLMTSAIGVLAVTDPIGLIPVMLAASERDPARLRFIVGRCCSTFAVTLVLMAWLGSGLLGVLGISIEAFRIAGGLIVLPLGLRMLNGQSIDLRRKQTHPADISDAQYAVVPLGIPIMAGPGTISLVISQAPDAMPGLLAFSGVLLAVSVFVYGVLRQAVRISRLLGEMGISILTRIMGILLVAIAVQVILEGITGFMLQAP